MYRHYVYLHRRKDTGEVFYVGKGTLRKRHRTQRCERAHSEYRRNEYWKRIAAKHGFTVEIFASCETDEFAQELEISLIKQYGRASLANLTDGGEGASGRPLTEKHRQHLSELAKRPRTDAWVQSIRRARKNGGNGGVVKKGDKLPQWWKDRIAATKYGTDNPMFGRCGEAHPNRRAVIDIATGTTYPTTTAAAKAVGMRMQTLHNMLTGFRKNSTSMSFA
jgi:hypothetical protein